MKYKLFHEDYIERVPPYLTSEKYLNYFVAGCVASYLVDFGNYPKKTGIIEDLEKYYGFSNIFVSGMKAYLDNNFSKRKKKNLCYITDDDVTAYKQTQEFIKTICELENIPLDSIIEKLNFYAYKSSSDIDKLIIYSSLYDIKANRRNLDDCASRIYIALCKNRDDSFKDINYYIAKIENDYLNKSIQIILANDSFKSLCSVLNIETVSDLIYLSASNLFGLFALFIDDLIDGIKRLSFDINHLSNISDLVSKAFSNISEQEEDILYERYVSYKTLEEIGKKYNVTRERIRQLEQVAFNKILSELDKRPTEYIYIFDKIISEYRLGYINELKEFLSENKLGDHLLIILSIIGNENSLGINFDFVSQIFDELGFSFDSKSRSGKDYEKDFLKSNPYILASDVDYLSPTKQEIVSEKYFKYGKYFIRNKYNMGDIVAYLCDTYFSNGFNVASSSQRAELVRHHEKIFGISIHLLSSSSLAGGLTRRDFILCGRGTYKNKKYCPEMSEKLVLSIVDYIERGQRITTHYASIFKYFEPELVRLGIDNYWLLKGLLDPRLPDHLVPHRDYVTNTKLGINETPTDEMYAFAHSFPGVFSLDDFNGQFPGVRETVFLNFFFYEENNHRLVALSNKRYIYYRNIRVPHEIKNMFDDYVENYFQNFKYKTINASVIYSDLALQRPDILEGLNIAGENSFSFFSYLRAAHPYKYAYHRPYISLDSHGKHSHLEILLDFISDKDRFTPDDVYPFMDYNGISRNHYIKLVERACPTHVEIDAGVMIKKEIINISNEDLEEIKKSINTLTMKSGELNTKDFDAYFVFPDIGYDWNKYLLAGITRSYFSNEFDVSNTNMSFDKTDFVIRRKAL